MLVGAFSVIAKSLRTIVSSSSDNAVTLYHSNYVPRCVALLAASQQWQEMFHPIEAPRQ